jgi:hypothetical protein
MAAFYQAFGSTRTTVPDLAALLITLRTQDITIGMQFINSKSYIVKKNSAWTAAQITSVQNSINAAAVFTAARQAQTDIDQWPISQMALVLALVDEINNIRGSLAPPQPPITPAQAIAKVRAKAGTL